MANHATPAPDAQPPVPSETLRRAAAAIRKVQDVEENLGHIAPTAFAAWLAVADWLEAEASGAERFQTRTQTPRQMVQPRALAVARAYLGEA